MKKRRNIIIVSPWWEKKVLDKLSGEFEGHAFHDLLSSVAYLVERSFQYLPPIK